MVSLAKGATCEGQFVEADCLVDHVPGVGGPTICDLTGGDPPVDASGHPHAKRRQLGAGSQGVPHFGDA